MEKTKDLYDVLGVDRKATPSQIKMARRARAKALHPDREHGDEAEMAQINAAYEVLSDPQRRRRYDQSGETSVERTREDEVRALFVKALKSVINDKGNIVLNLQRTMSEAIDEGAKLLEEAEENVRQAWSRAKRLKRAEHSDPLLVETLEAHAMQGEELIAKARAQMSILVDARKLADGYESDEEDAPPKFEASMLEAMLTSMSLGAKSRRM